VLGSLQSPRAAVSESIDFRRCGPIYAIVQREAVELVGETLVVMDAGFRRTLEITAELKDTIALLLYTKPEYAAEFLAIRDEPAYVAATFRGLRRLATYLEDSRSPGVILNRIPGRHDGAIIKGADFIEVLKQWMALGRDAI
jgi:hypothetical protein